jgi:hypothetical protein
LFHAYRRTWRSY